MVTKPMELSPDSVTLKEFFNTRFTSMESRLDDISRSLDGLRTQSNIFISRSDYEAKHTALENKVDNLQRIVYTGMGLLLGVEFLLKFFIK